MATKHVCDTHALVWYLEGNSRLGAAAKAVLNDSGSELVAPLIALAEACWVIEKGRTSIPSVGDFLAAIDGDPRIEVTPLGRDILDRSLSLSTIDEMHDRLIVATALMLADRGHTIDFLTRDSKIATSALVTVIW